MLTKEEESMKEFNFFFLFNMSLDDEAKDYYMFVYKRTMIMLEKEIEVLKAKEVLSH